MVLLPCPMTRDVRWPIVDKNWDLMLREVDQVFEARILALTQKESGSWLHVLPVSSLGKLGHYWTLRALGLPLPSEWALIFVFLILAATAGR